jgi:hypothetical protein
MVADRVPAIVSGDPPGDVLPSVVARPLHPGELEPEIWKLVDW